MCRGDCLNFARVFAVELMEAAELLGVPHETLKLALTSRNLDYKVELSSSEAIYDRDVLLRNLYSRLFTWIVSEINRAIITVSMFSGFARVSLKDSS